MKGLYLSNIDPNKSYGYMPKILGQVKGFHQLGFDMELICFSQDHQIVLTSFYTSETGQELSSKSIMATAGRNLLVRRFNLLRQALKYMATNHVQFLYLRYPRSDPLFLYFLARLRHSYPHLIILSEFPTFPYDQEYAGPIGLKDAIVFFLDKLTRRHLSHFIDRVVSVNYEKPIFGIPSLSIDNGIHVADYAAIPCCSTNAPSTLNLIGVANVSPWHGYDRVLHGLGHYYAQDRHPDRIVIFHIVGAVDPYLKELQALVTQLQITDYVFFHTPCQGQALEAIFADCQLAIGVLGGHRKGLEIMSPLKNREYCARGIPFIFSHEDPDFLADFPYALRLVSSDEPVDISLLIQFTERMHLNLSMAREMRNYAIENLDWSVKMQKVADAIHDVLKTKGDNTR